MYIDKISPGFLSGAKSCNSLSLSSYVRWSLLDSLQCVHISFVLACLKQDKGHQTWPCQCWAGRKDPFPWPDGSVLPNAAINLLFRKGTLLAYVQPGVQQNHQILFCQAVFRLASFWNILVHGIVPSQMENSALHLGELHEVPIISISIISHFHHFSSLFRCLWNGNMATPPSLVSAANSLRVHSALSSW